MRLAAVDLGSNSTRLLIADLDDEGRLTELERRATVTRLGQGVDRTGSLDPVAITRVTDELMVVRRLLDDHHVERAVGVLTSAVRDADNGPEFTARVRDEFGIDARTIPGEQEAALTFLGATSGREPSDERIAVVDVGGGSTEFVVGRGREVDFSVSVQAGVVRQSERHVEHDPPHNDELIEMADDVRTIFAEAVPDEVRAGVDSVIAVAGTATSCAAMAQELDPYDPDRVHGYRLTLAEIEQLLARLAQMEESERRRVAGLQPDRAPTIVAGCVLLSNALRLFDARACEVSEHDILRGAVIAAATGDL
ncbi:Exopolyphosphatase [Patulibacter medicamentivorans]|uniref:Exopolyphosphatase n=1 Tax=Patulibacter medicamentivorans TaxID=1097667 RepID=H0EAR4_9ACTN|nr:Ppx/GppA phosphatase family protein [Patulibacter medicamentivorans]EHN09239.1 Exopolyphosphatase [Patulibacter medicamentivorans]